MTQQTLEALRAGQLAGTRELKLACGLGEFPREILSLADTLEVLDLSGNALSELPETLAQLPQLRILFCSNNRFTRLPDVLGRCPSLSMVGFKSNRISEVPASALPPALRWLILTDNAIEQLPDAIGRCSQLQKLMLSGNQLQDLPETLQHCHALELLRVAANRLEAFPKHLLELPRLTWLAFAGNPLTRPRERAALEASTLPNVPWSALELESRLGEGASGTVYRARQRGVTAPVAVKLFKGAVTSDGLPESEMAAALSAGKHPGLIRQQGRVTGHPAGTPGLVLSLVDPSWRTLAGPPSLASCTRDIYADDLCLSIDAVQGLARGVASAAAHLHGRGLLHGDLYAHNILFDGVGRGLIGDFGAASLYSADGGDLAQRLQRLEVRAFGILLEEWLARSPADWPGRPALSALQAACCQRTPAMRPTFGEIVSALASVG